MAWPPRALKEDYGLQTILPNYEAREDIPLGGELVAFKAWCTEPFHLGRGMAYPNPVKEVTFAWAQETIHAMCGFLVKVRTGGSRG